MKGITLSEEGHLVNMLAPISCTAARSSKYVSLKNYAHLTAFVQTGVNVSPTNIKVYEAADSTGGSAAAITFDYQYETTDYGDTPAARATATATGYTATGHGDNRSLIIELDASKLSDGKPYVKLLLSASTAAQYASVAGILTGARFGQELTPTALT